MHAIPCIYAATCLLAFTALNHLYRERAVRGGNRDREADEGPSLSALSSRILLEANVRALLSVLPDPP